MNAVTDLIGEVKLARIQYLQVVSTCPEGKVNWRCAPESWNLIDITEHLYWAEHGGIFGMWKTLHAIRNGTYAKTTESKFKNFPIQQIIDQTWQAKEKVPAVAAPRMGGTLIFWRHALASLQSVLEAFGHDLKEEELRVQAHPHPISGPMDFQQRLEFLAFHIRRHHGQASELLSNMPSTIE